MLQNSTLGAEKDGVSYTECPNQLADAEAAFKLLHFLHHLNGAAFTTFSSMHINYFNPTILRALTQHYLRAKGSPYRSVPCPCVQHRVH